MTPYIRIIGVAEGSIIATIMMAYIRYMATQSESTQAPLIIIAIMSIASKKQVGHLDRMLTMEMARVVEAAAVAAARERGQGDEKKADQVAVDAMRTELNNLPISGSL